LRRSLLAMRLRRAAMAGLVLGAASCRSARETEAREVAIAAVHSQDPDYDDVTVQSARWDPASDAWRVQVDARETHGQHRVGSWRFWILSRSELVYESHWNVDERRTLGEQLRNPL